MDKHTALKQYFGHSAFRFGQEEIIDHILSGADCLAVMPTGAGKSMCYQIPALILHGVTLVISPLISLMKDQVEALAQSGVPAAYINSSLPPHEYYATLRMLSAGEIKILYVAPERLLSEDFLALCKTLAIPLVAVDEAHCVSHWGQDFRPSYLKIAPFVNALPKRPVLAAFTATATEAVKRDIEDMLELNSPYSITTGFDRQNLYFEVRKCANHDKNALLLNILRGAGGKSSIVYCSTRKNVEQVCAFLKLNGLKATMYHAGLKDEQRRQAQDDFIFDRCDIIVATNAFGMGIDKSDVSLVVHYNMPKDIESYYQEAGRAGRDGSPARCIMLYSPSDFNINKFIIQHSYEDSELSESEIKEMRSRDLERLQKMTFYCTTKYCLREFILRYFGERSSNFCGNCSTCNSSYDTLDITVQAQKIISCIFRMQQRGIYGSKTLVKEILSGECADKRTQELSTYGIMKTEGKRIDAVTNYLIEGGYIQNGDSSCEITQLGSEFIKKRQTLLMKQRKSTTQEAPAAAISEMPAAESPCNPELFERLKQLRKEIAATLGVPAYVVFTDATLREISVKQPLTTRDFMNISGIGSIKAERYSKKFAKIITQYQEEKSVKS